jgi:hypothetical protein
MRSQFHATRAADVQLRRGFVRHRGGEGGGSRSAQLLARGCLMAPHCCFMSTAAGCYCRTSLTPCAPIAPNPLSHQGFGHFGVSTPDVYKLADTIKAGGGKVWRAHLMDT